MPEAVVLWIMFGMACTGAGVVIYLLLWLWERT